MPNVWSAVVYHERFRLDSRGTTMLLGCDTMVALPSSTKYGQTLFAKNSDRPTEECQPLVQRPNTSHASGTVVRCQFIDLPQVPTTYAHVGSRPYSTVCARFRNSGSRAVGLLTRAAGGCRLALNTAQDVLSSVSVVSFSTYFAWSLSVC